jgi:hypothetical protein
MTYIVNDSCIACKYNRLCRGLPRGLFLRENMLVIHPDECITGLWPRTGVSRRDRDNSRTWKKVSSSTASIPELWPVIINERSSERRGDDGKRAEFSRETARRRLVFSNC